MSGRQKTPLGYGRVRATILIALVLSILACLILWLIPVQTVQQWAFERAGQDAYQQFEAIGKAEFMHWLLCIASTVGSMLLWWIWWGFERWSAWSVLAWNGLLSATDVSQTSTPLPGWSFVCLSRTIGFRVILAGWLILFAAHFVHAIGERAHEWPYFRFNSGNVVLPNISDSNRAVIRYLQETTPPTARILVVSDQKLFFLSYYLRPRTLFHRMHPDAEHVIPLKNQERKLNAYRLDELTERDLLEIPHDYTLEYFEHPDMVDREHLLDDHAWIAFIRQRERNPTYVPSYSVRLRAVGGSTP